jgi:hypothetical protein
VHGCSPAGWFGLISLVWTVEDPHGVLGRACFLNAECARAVQKHICASITMSISTLDYGQSRYIYYC